LEVAGNFEQGLAVETAGKILQAKAAAAAHCMKHRFEWCGETILGAIEIERE
jgi:hypothetical protein